MLHITVHAVHVPLEMLHQCAGDHARLARAHQRIRSTVPVLMHLYVISDFPFPAVLRVCAHQPTALSFLYNAALLGCVVRHDIPYSARRV